MPVPQDDRDTLVVGVRDQDVGAPVGIEIAEPQVVRVGAGGRALWGGEGAVAAAEERHHLPIIATEVVVIGQNEIDMTIAVEIPRGDPSRFSSDLIQDGGEDQLWTHGRIGGRGRGSRGRPGKDARRSMTREKPGQQQNSGYSDEALQRRTMDPHGLGCSPGECNEKARYA